MGRRDRETRDLLCWQEEQRGAQSDAAEQLVEAAASLATACVGEGLTLDALAQEVLQTIAAYRAASGR